MIAALFDSDGTLTTGNVWQGLMAYRARRGERRLAEDGGWEIMEAPA